MKPDAPLDYAVFQLSPRHSRCELLVSSNGHTEKLASGLIKPFVAHLKVAEEQAAQAVHSIKLELERHGNAQTWFTKGTLERFVRFVSTPEVLEMVNTFDAEMSQLEGARRIYSQGTDNQLSGALGGDGTGTAAGADATKKELMRAIDVRLTAVKQDLTASFARASAAGFNPETVLELQLFADWFGAHRLNEACHKFISLCERRSELINPWRPAVEDQVVRASWGSDMSIDEPSEEPSGSLDFGSHYSLQNKQHQQAGQLQQQLKIAQNQDHLEQSKPSTFYPSLPVEQVPVHKDNQQEQKKKESVDEPLPIQSSQTARRLSVQDRINLFENKQKENSGGKPAAVVKPAELRRLPSDVSSAPAVEKAVLRRWSGASDMSIDLGNDKKDNDVTESPLCTPTLSAVSQSKSNVFPSTTAEKNDQRGLKETESSVKAEAKSVSGAKDQNELPRCTPMGTDDVLALMGKANWKDRVGSQVQLRSYIDKSDQVGVVPGVREENVKGSFGGDFMSSGPKVQGGLEVRSREVPGRGTVAVKNQASLLAPIAKFAVTAGDAELHYRVEDVQIRDQQLCQSFFKTQTHTRSHSAQFEGGFELRAKEVSSKDSEGDQLPSQPEWRSFTSELPQEAKDGGFLAENPAKVEDLRVPRMKAQKPLSAAPEQSGMLPGSREESGSAYGNNKLAFRSKKVIDNQQSLNNPPPPFDKVQRVRQSKGNQELNDELKMKANELEKLFAEHKQYGSARRNKPAELQVEQAISSQNGKPAAFEITPTQHDKKTDVEPTGSVSESAKFNTPSPVKMVDLDYCSSLKQSFSKHGFSDDSRGEFYEKYMQKRDAKLRQEWGTKRAEKEAKLRAMQDRLERSRAEMKAKFSGTADKSMSSTRQRAEKFRALQSRSSFKSEQHLIESLWTKEDEDPSDFMEHKCYRQDRSFEEASPLDGDFKSAQNRKFFQSINLASSPPCTTAAAAAILRSSAKISSSGSGKRRTQSENPLAQSVPNFFDFRKENTKPSSGVSKTANRTQPRTYARSSTSEETSFAKEDKSRRSQSLRKSSAGPDSKALSLTSDDVLAPLRLDKEQSEDGLYEKVPMNVAPKHFLRKGNSVGHSTGTSIAKLKASMMSEAIRNEEESEESPSEADDLVNVAKEEEEEEQLGTTEIEDNTNNGNGKAILSRESDKMSESENNDSLRSLTQVDPSPFAELPNSIPSSTFYTVGSLQDSPGESPVSWNSGVNNPFSYSHEISDIDASVDSAMGSPVSWNSHSPAQAGADAARMRKKWGSAQKPILVSNSSQNLARKDVTKGFKLLLKFGRKNRGAESWVDWVSTTTSEGDDDSEDGRDSANRSSDDLRKSRMGFSQNNAFDDGFNENELFNEQVQVLHSSIPAPPANFKLRDDHMSGSSIKAPRSFFSLSTFRSKGSESKLR